ncbi:MAG: ribonuclease P protein component [Rikenellaceae bacterium]
METNYSLSYHERIRSRGSIRRLFDSGKRGFVYPIQYMWFAEGEGDSVDSLDSLVSESISSVVVTSEIIDSEAKSIENKIETEEFAKHKCEVLFSVPKRKHKRANKRNLLRRRIKESYRLHKMLLLDAQSKGTASKGSLNIDLALIYSTKEVHSYKTINHAVRKILENIAQDL